MIRAAILCAVVILAGCSGDPALDRARLGAAMAAAGEGMTDYGQGLAAAAQRRPVNCTSQALGAYTYTTCQ